MGKFFKKFPTELTHTTYNTKTGKVISKIKLKGHDAAQYMRGFMKITDKAKKMVKKSK